MGGKWNRRKAAQRRIWSKMTKAEREERLNRMKSGMRKYWDKVNGTPHTQKAPEYNLHELLQKKSITTEARKVTITITME